MKHIRTYIRQFIRIVAGAGMVGASFGCAGPSTPLGAVWSVHPSQVNQPRLALMASYFKPSTWRSQNPNEPAIAFVPSRQVLHAAKPLTLVIRDPKGFNDSKQLVIRHNGFDVTTSFLAQAKIKKTHDRMVVRVPLVRLSPAREHQIEVAYGKPGHEVFQRLEAPRCDVSADRTVFSTDEFRPAQKIVDQIHNISREHGLNPVLTAGLIAQESGFNSKLVSWARAIGLTQVTTVADSEIGQLDPRFNRYPRFPGIHEMPILWVQTMVNTGAINEQNEWRLESEHSIRGGVVYLKYLVRRWSAPENQEIIRKLYGEDDAPEATTRLVLASYNSGYARVYSALVRLENSWLLAPELKEARRYVARIFSYCEHFAEPAFTLDEQKDLELYSRTPAHSTRKEL